MEAWSSPIKSCLAAWTRKLHTSGEDRRASQAVHCVGGTERERESERNTLSSKSVNWRRRRRVQQAAAATPPPPLLSHVTPPHPWDCSPAVERRS